VFLSDNLAIMTDVDPDFLARQNERIGEHADVTRLPFTPKKCQSSGPKLE
jgi:hypothetical protein